MNGDAPARLSEVAAQSPEDVLAALRSTAGGLSSGEATRRLDRFGPNSLRSHGARPLAVLLRQLRNPLLILLIAAASTSLLVGESTGAAIILSITALSVGLGFLNEYRSERAVEALHQQLRHTALVMRDGRPVTIDVTELVPGDVVRIGVGDVVAADLRLLEIQGLACDEAVLTGEAIAAEKQTEPAQDPASPLALASCAFMGTVVREGGGAGIVVQTGARTEFGKIAMRLGERQPPTAFQLGLRDFSLLLVRITMALAGSILIINVAIGRSLLESSLFALAIAVGLTPQLLPAIVTVSLSTGARRLAERRVIVKRLVAIEDLGNIELLFTDKTGTLTEGRIAFSAALDAGGESSLAVMRAGLLCNDAVLAGGEVVSGNELDQALWRAADQRARDLGAARRIAARPFDPVRRLASVLVEEGNGDRRVIVKGAPELVLDRCRDVAPAARAVLEREFDAGSRVVAVATRAPATSSGGLGPDDERDLELAGFLTFVDRPKTDAASAVERLARLDVAVKVITGDNDRVARKVCADLGMPAGRVITGAELERLSDDELMAALPETTIFARVTPEQKSRVIRAARERGTTTGFLGDGINDAVALHDADVGISVSTATEVARDAADVVLMAKELDILADGVVEGRRIFANTIKYVLMGTSSNFGNMFSAAGGSLVLGFLPMLPTQILLNNLLYDVSQMAIPTDRVDEEMIARPAHWDIGFIRRFMGFFGPISSIFDFATFAVMLWVLDAGHDLFRTGWFVESLATQCLVIFVIRTRRVPFIRSRPSRTVLATTITCVGVGAVLPFTPLAGVLGFKPLPADFFAILALMVVAYLALAEAGKARFFRPERRGRPLALRRSPELHRIQRRASRWSHRAPVR